ncbi:MAG: tetraacyldisaccharide 4'-kinase [Planctomycetota bacterium]
MTAASRASTSLGPFDGTPLAPLVSALGSPLEKLYLNELSRRNKRYDAGRGVVTLDRPVISVGNISLGGTGKTPMVRWVVERLLAGGHRPAIAMRGYGAKSGAPSDEQDEYQRAFPTVPVVAQPNRTEGLLTLFHSDAGADVDCVVLDDGFQHRRLARALDIVLLDLNADSLRDRCLPAGRLREPPANLARADAVVLTHAENTPESVVEETSTGVERLTGRPPVAVTRHEWQGFESSEPDARPQRVHLACAIGNPGPFLEPASKQFELMGQTILRDHDPFGRKTVDALRADARRAGALLCTNKDWSKLRRHAWPVPVLRPRLSHGFVRGEGELRERIAAAARAGRPLESPHD